MIAVVLTLCLAAEWEYREALMQTPIAGTSRELVAADVRRFRVLSSAEAARNLRVAQSHENYFDGEVQTYNTPARYRQWREECWWRQQCWRELAVALDDTYQHTPWYRGRSVPERIAYRVEALEALRRLLGEEAFWAGYMPSPTPSYRGLER